MAIYAVSVARHPQLVYFFSDLNGIWRQHSKMLHGKREAHFISLDSPALAENKIGGGIVFSIPQSLMCLQYGCKLL